MQPWTLDNHPTLEQFRKKIDLYSKESNKRFHLFLTPPFAPSSLSIPFYLFYVGEGDDSIMTQFASHNTRLIFEKNVATLFDGSKKGISMRVLMTTHCTTSHGFSYVLHEIENDFYKPVSPLPSVYLKLMDAYNDPNLSFDFLQKGLTGNSLHTLVRQIDDAIFLMDVDPSKREEFVDRMKVSIDQIASAAYATPEFSTLPVFAKNKLNFLIYNAITAKCHFKLIRAYHSAMALENSNAQKGLVARTTTSKADEERLVLAVSHLKGVLHVKTPAEAINHIVAFFDEVVAALPGVDIAADDILPAICVGMARDITLASHVVSFFTYLVDIWPSYGMDERITYILVTCSIAASHLSLPPKPEKKPNASVNMSKTINELEDLLSFI